MNGTGGPGPQAMEWNQAAMNSLHTSDARLASVGNQLGTYVNANMNMNQGMQNGLNNGFRNQDSKIAAGDWAQDFSALSLQNNNNTAAGAQSHQYHQPTNGFVNHHRQPIQQIQPMYNAPMMQQPFMPTQLNHQEITQKEAQERIQQDELFKSVFEQVESELKTENGEPKEETKPQEDQTKEDSQEEEEEAAGTDDLSQIAAHIVNNIDRTGNASNTNAKLENSNFMKLMSQLSEKSVVLQEDKFVEVGTGKDVRENFRAGAQEEEDDEPVQRLQEQKQRQPSDFEDDQAEDPILDRLGEMDLSNMGPYELAYHVTGVGHSEWEEAFDE